MNSLIDNLLTPGKIWESYVDYETQDINVLLRRSVNISQVKKFLSWVDSYEDTREEYNQIVSEGVPFVKKFLERNGFKYSEKSTSEIHNHGRSFRTEDLTTDINITLPSDQQLSYVKAVCGDSPAVFKSEMLKNEAVKSHYDRLTGNENVMKLCQEAAERFAEHLLAKADNKYRTFTSTIAAFQSGIVYDDVSSRSSYSSGSLAYYEGWGMKDLGSDLNGKDFDIKQALGTIVGEKAYTLLKEAPGVEAVLIKTGFVRVPADDHHVCGSRITLYLNADEVREAKGPKKILSDW